MGRAIAIAERRAPPPPPQYVWSFPGSPVKVQVDLDFVKRLQQHLQTLDGNVEGQGLLLGKASGQGTEIQDFKIIPGSETPSISTVVAAVPDKGVPSPVGYYRIQRDAVLRMTEEDTTLVEAVFPEPQQVFLLIQAGDSGPANATFFFWDEGRMCGDISLLEFPFDAELLAAGEERKLELAQQKAAAKRQAAQARLAETALPPPVRKAWPKALLWGMVGVAIVVAGIAAGVMVQRFPEKFTLRSPIVNTVPAAAPAEVPLGLLAERHNGDLKLTWNRQSGAIINATTGTLSIQDGEAKREITLDATQLHSGSILYAPATEQVQLQLTVAGPQSTTSESVIVVVPKVGSPQVQPVAHKELPAGLPAPTLAETMARYHPTRPFTAPSARPVTPSQPVIEPPVPVVRTDFTAVAPSLALVNPSLRAPQPPPPAAPAPNPAASQPAARPPAEVSPPIYYPPSIVHQVVPNFPGSLRGMVVISKTVEIKVLIDEAGKVLKADAMPSQDGTPQLMIRAALEAARKWKFHPARRGTTPISSEMILRFEFKPPS